MRHKTLFGALLVLAGLIVAALVLGSRDPGPPSVSITSGGFTNYPRLGPRAVFILRNDGGEIIRRQQICYFAWTNPAGVLTNSYATLIPEHTRIYPGETEVVTTGISPDPGPWRTDFLFSVEPRPLRGFMLEAVNWMAWAASWRQNDLLPRLFAVRGPEVVYRSKTNALETPGRGGE